MQLTKEKLEAVKALAEKAMIGTRWYRPKECEKVIQSVFPFGRDYDIAKFDDADCAAFVEAANPDFVQALCDLALEALASRSQVEGEPVANLKAELEDARAYAFQDGIRHAHKGIHVVEMGLQNYPENLTMLFEIGAKGKICRFRRDGEEGDASVGMPGWEAWVLHEDQSGTVLGALIDLAQWIATAQGEFHEKIVFTAQEEWDHQTLSVELFFPTKLEHHEDGRIKEFPDHIPTAREALISYLTEQCDEGTVLAAAPRPEPQAGEPKHDWTCASLVKGHPGPCNCSLATPIQE